MTLEPWSAWALCLATAIPSFVILVHLGSGFRCWGNSINLITVVFIYLDLISIYSVPGTAPGALAIVINLICIK